MIQESKWTVVNGEAHDTHIVCVQHAGEKVNHPFSKQHQDFVKLQVVFEATDKILQNYVIPQCSEKVNNGNGTEWSPIQSAIIQVQVINKIRRPQSRSPIC